MTGQEDINKKFCPQCGKSFAGRSDKKFCCEQCKNDFHNGMRISEKKLKTRILRNLNTNYRILSDLVDMDKKEAEVSDLSSLGFNPTLVTGYSRSPKGNNIFRCFDIRYCISDARIHHIKKTIRDKN